MSEIHPVHVLVVDDHAISRKVAARLLTKLGCTVDLARDGNEALSLFRDTHFDAVLLDCQMPDPNGYAVTAGIRQMEQGARRTPIIAATAYGETYSRERCIRAGMEDLLAKPLKSDTLQAMLARWVHTLREEATFDPEVLMSYGFGEDDEGELMAFLAEFAVRARKSIQHIRERLEGEDFAGCLREAHGLRGSCATTGTRRMHTVIEALEAAVRAADSAGVEDRLTALEGELLRILRKLEA